MPIKIPTSRKEIVDKIESLEEKDISSINLFNSSLESETPIKEILKNFNLAVDCEYAQKCFDTLRLDTLAITSYIPNMGEPEYFDKDELDEDFNVIGEHLKRKGYQVEKVYKRELEDKLQKLWNRYYPKGRNADLEHFKAKKVVVIEFESLGVDIEKCKIILDKKKKIRIQFDKLTVTINGFFLYADLFKIFGKNWRYIWTETAKLTQYRTIKIMGIVRYSLVIEGIPTDIELDIFDERYVFPPRHGSLEGQCKTFGVELNKISISEEIEKRYGDKVTEKWCKSNMDIVRLRYPDIFQEYAKRDVVTTWLLHQKLLDMLRDVCEALELNTELDERFRLDLAETCGKNIENILKALIQKHFGEDSKELIDKLMASGRSEALAKLDGNQFGILPSKVVGGLLFSRTSLEPLIEGILFDLDEASCYATALCAMSLYLGQPIHLTYKYEKPKLRTVYKRLQKMGVPMDAWGVRASGTLNKAFNTLILSDLRFNPEEDILTNPDRYKMPDDYDSAEDETLNLIDAEKSSDAAKNCKILYKEIKHGYISEATMTALSDLPDEWYEEFMDLEVDALIYYHPDLIADSVEEYNAICDNLPDNHLNELLTDDLLKESKVQLSKQNVSLKFPIGEYYKTVKALRKKYKNAKNSVQEIFKLILNSTYGVMASLVMKVNNPIAANWITSCARAAAWRMVNSLNGFAPITDGTGGKLESVPFGKKFKNILKDNPNYLIHYDPNIKNEKILSLTFKDAGDFNQLYIDHLESFIDKSDWLTRMFAYDLKDEKGVFTYNKHYNTGAGNYVKNGSWGDTFKCRSYQELPELTKWFKAACEGDYTSHLIYAEKEVIKLSQGSIDAIRILKDAGDVANNGKRRILMPPDLAIQIATDGIAHPMGYSKNSVKLLKLISPSQFMCQDERQANILNNAYEECKQISKILLPRVNWNSELDWDYLRNFKAYGSDGEFEVKCYDFLDYAAYNQKSPCGLGFEVLIWGNREINNLKDARLRIAEILEDYDPSNDDKFNLRASLHLQRCIENLENNKYITHLLAATQIIKLNFEYEYRLCLANSVVSPTHRVCFLEDITDLKRENSKI